MSRPGERADAAGFTLDAAGFTLIEAMVVVFIAALLLALSFRGVERSMEVMRFESGVSMLRHKLTETRTNAIMQGRTTWLLIDGQNGFVQMQATDELAATVDVGFPSPLPEAIGFQTETPFQVRFDAMGRATAAHDIVLEAGDLQKTLFVSATGRVTVN